MCRMAHIDKVNAEWIEYYFSLCNTVVRIKEHVGKQSVFEGRQEGLINDPEGYLRKLCFFLGVNCPESYLKNCASIIDEKPNMARNDSVWDKEMIDRVKQEMIKFDFLKDYVFEN